MVSIATFFTENDHGPGRHGIQWQLSQFTITCIAIDFAFARQILDFVAHTRANPLFRDIRIGEGVYRETPEMTVELTPCFSGVQFQVSKIGEWDDGYSFRISSGSDFWILFELHEQELDDFLNEMRDIDECRTRR